MLRGRLFTGLIGFPAYSSIRFSLFNVVWCFVFMEINKVEVEKLKLIHSTSLSTCQIWWSRLETIIVLKPIFCCYQVPEWQHFWQLHVSCKFHSFVILDLGNGKWQVWWLPGKYKRFLVRIPGQNFPCLDLARNHIQYIIPSSNSNPVPYWVARKLIQNSSHKLAKLSSLFSAFRKCLKLQNWYQNDFYSLSN